MSKQHVIHGTADSAPAPATGFEPASPDEPGMPNIDSALARNRAFAAAGGHNGAVVFPNLRLFVIANLRDHAVPDPAASVTTDAERLRSAAAIPPRVSVSGHVYDAATDLVQTILPARCKDSESVPALPTMHVVQTGAVSS
jgi:hypothetical protein